MKHKRTHTHVVVACVFMFVLVFVCRLIRGTYNYDCVVMRLVVGVRACFVYVWNANNIAR